MYTLFTRSTNSDRCTGVALCTCYTHIGTLGSKLTGLDINGEVLLSVTNYGNPEIFTGVCKSISVVTLALLIYIPPKLLYGPTLSPRLQRQWLPY